MQPLVLAIEPDTRQAAIVKRIVREKVMAEVAVVDSRDAALDAIRTTIPDVLLLSALMSPRDEDELIAHLRTLPDAQHLQTHTIPQLSSSFGDEDDRPRGLLSAFRRKKSPERVTGGCDPELFAEEIRAYLKRASDKKREVRETGPMAPIASPVARPAAPASAKTAQPSAAEQPVAESSWESPFEWRPTQSRVVPVETPSRAAPMPATASAIITPEPFVAEPEPPIHDPVLAEPLVREPEPATYEPEPAIASAPQPISDWRSLLKDSEPIREPEPIPEPEPAAAEPMAVVAELVAYDAEPVTFAAEPVAFAAEPVAFVEEPVARYVDEPTTYAAEPAAVIDEPFVYSEESELPPLTIVSPRSRYPLTVRKAKGWWFVEGSDEPSRSEPESELNEVLAGLAVPHRIAGVGYAEGCRIRRVRLVEAA